MVRRIELALEELFTNTVRHGYCRECDSPVWLEAIASPGELRLVYQDAAPAFDPLQYLPEPDLTFLLEGSPQLSPMRLEARDAAYAVYESLGGGTDSMARLVVAGRVAQPPSAANVVAIGAAALGYEPCALRDGAFFPVAMTHDSF